MRRGDPLFATLLMVLATVALAVILYVTVRMLTP